jgi:hypothetical protein
MDRSIMAFYKKNEDNLKISSFIKFQDSKINEIFFLKFKIFQKISKKIQDF